MRDGIKCFSTVEENCTYFLSISKGFKPLICAVYWAVTVDVPSIDRQLVGDGTEVFHDKWIDMSLQYSQNSVVLVNHNYN